MLFVETSNQREQLLLEEEFIREGNIFTVPLARTNVIKSLLETILFEIFGQKNLFGRSQCKPMSNLSQVMKKLTNFLQNTLNLKFSLENLRQIFQIIKHQEKKILLYQQYITSLNNQIMKEIEQDCEILGKYQQMNEQRDINEVFLQQMKKGNPKIEQRHTGLIGLDFVTEVNEQQYPLLETRRKNRNSISSKKFGFDVLSPTSEDASTMHTLKSQVPTSPKFIEHFVNGINFDNFNNTSSFKLEDEIDEKQLHLNLHNRQDQRQNSPSEKEQRSLMRSPSTQQASSKKKLFEQSDFADLSGRVHPVPSFLNDDNSLKEMIVKQKNQQIRKSKILRQSLIKPWLDNQSSKDQKYTSNLRQIKYQNKLRKNSNKNFDHKKNLDFEVEFQYKKPQRKMAASFMGTNKMNKLFKINEKKDQEGQEISEEKPTKIHKNEKQNQKFKFGKTFS